MNLIKNALYFLMCYITRNVVTVLLTQIGQLHLHGCFSFLYTLQFVVIKVNFTYNFTPTTQSSPLPIYRDIILQPQVSLEAAEHYRRGWSCHSKDPLKPHQQSHFVLLEGKNCVYFRCVGVWVCVCVAYYHSSLRRLP